jgi:hypothetical protein
MRPEVVQYVARQAHSLKSIETLIYTGTKSSGIVSSRYAETYMSIRLWSQQDASRTDAIRILQTLKQVHLRYAQTWERLCPPWWEEEHGELIEQSQAQEAMRTAARQRKQRRDTDFF